MYFYSVVIPVYNRPNEIDELLNSLTRQTYSHFEVIIVEDGSTDRCDDIAEKYAGDLKIRYFYKPNTGQGFSRNFGFKESKGDYFVVFDSDCLIPEHYFQTIDDHLAKHPLDAFGGPDKAREDFTITQKAISYSMTSLFTTGGIRGNKKHVGVFHPRSFNMGISRQVFEKTGGYIITRMGEDIEFSIRIINLGFKTGLIEEAYVFHKRRTSLGQFYNQLHFFGRARINVGRFFPKEVKLVHTFPAVFTLGLVSLVLLPFISLKLFTIGVVIYTIYSLLLLTDAIAKTKNLSVAAMSMAAAFTQLTAYGIGFMTEGLRKALKE